LTLQFGRKARRGFRARGMHGSEENRHVEMPTARHVGEMRAKNSGVTAVAEGFHLISNGFYFNGIFI